MAWFEQGYEDEEGNVLATADQATLSDDASGGYNYPIVGVIQRVYYANSSENVSNSQKNVISTNEPDSTIDGEGFLSVSEYTTLEKGWRLEADVKVVRGPAGFVDSSKILPKVPICIGFGGVKNYGYVVPTATSNASTEALTGNENGDYCLVQFVSGEVNGHVITQIWPHPLNTIDPAITQEGPIAYMRVNGTAISISEEGDFLLDARDAAELVNTNSDSGYITRKNSSGPEGTISVVSRGDVLIAAGFPRENESETELPLGYAALRSSKLLTLRSTLDEVEINTEINDGSGSAMQVKIQNERGSLRPAARKYDKVKITSGDDGDLFSYIDTLHNLLEVVGKALAFSLIEPGAKAAGELINAFIGCHPKPSYQEGEIIEGSIYCQIAGKGTAADIGGDESGILDCDGNPISSTDLMAKTVSAYVEAAASGVVSQLNPNPINIAKGMVPTALNQTGMTLQKVPLPGVKAAGDSMVQASPYITLALEMVSTGELPENTPTPDSAQDAGYSDISDITGKRDEDGNVTTPGLLQEVDIAKNNYNWMVDREELDDAELKGKYGADTSWWPINPNTGVYYSYNDATGGSTPENFGTYILEKGFYKADLEVKSTESETVLSGFDESWLPLPAAQKLYAAAIVGGGGSGS